MRVVNMALLGCGTIGTGVVKTCVGQAEIIAKRLGAKLCLKRVVELDPEKGRGLGLDESVFTDDVTTVWNDPEIDIVIELIGGTGIALDFVLKAIDSGKNVVSANKALFAKHGKEIYRRAAEKNVRVKFEASVGGGIPIIESLVESFSANTIEEICGIVNGTCNYIFTLMRDEGKSFADALKAAQDKGYAEADPTFDINGNDSAHKMAIMASIAKGAWIDFDDVFVEGIEKITDDDIQFAAQMGFCIKLLGIMQNTDAGLQVRVHPSIISKDSQLAKVDGEFNAVFVKGNIVGESMFYGKGAGSLPTASAVVADCISIAKDIVSGAKCGGGVLFDDSVEVTLVDMGEIECSAYIRIMAVDSPGVLAKITGVFGKAGISIGSFLQKEKLPGELVPVVLMTHKAKQSCLMEAIKEISELDCVESEPVMIREHVL